MIPPNGCRWCGIEKPKHYNRFDSIHGWHQWVEPGDEVRKARLLYARASRDADNRLVRGEVGQHG